MKTKLKKYAGLGLAAAFWIAWIAALSVLGPHKLVELFGMRNSYLAAFTLAVLGGVSSVTAGPFYATIVALGAGGADIATLSLVAGAGLAISDSVFYLFGAKGRQALSGRAWKWAERLAAWVNQKPRWAVPLLAFFYMSLAPLPNDLLMVALAAGKYPYKKLLPVIICGDIAAVYILSWLSAAGVAWFWVAE